MTDKKLLRAARRRWLGQCLILGRYEYNGYLFPSHDKPDDLPESDAWFYKWSDSPEGIVYRAMQMHAIGREPLDITSLWGVIQCLSWGGLTPSQLRSKCGPAFLASLTDGVTIHPDRLTDIPATPAIRIVHADS